MISCSEICKSLNSFEKEQPIVIENFNSLFEQSVDFSKKYLQLVEDKIVESKWVDPNLEPEKFNIQKQQRNTGNTNGNNNINNITSVFSKLLIRL